MKKLISNNYQFLILFLLIILNEPIYKILMNPIKIDRVSDCEYLKVKYNDLLEFNNIDLEYNSEYINTYIIYKDIYNYMNEITIRGGMDLNLDNNAVVYNNVLLGVIDKVNGNSSIVKLLTSKNSQISVKINDEIGILEYKNNNLVVKNINNYSDISIGDKIYTSGLGKIQENIFIGTVENIVLDNKSIEKIITVDYKINIKDISFVTILKENK